MERQASSRPAVWLAVGLGAVTGGIVGLVFVGWLWMIAQAGGFGDGSTGLMRAVGWWGVFWVGLSLGLVGGFALAFRLWRGASGLAVKRAEASARRDAVLAAERLLREVRSHDSGPHDPQSRDQ
jgi:hypothetical protein